MNNQWPTNNPLLSIVIPCFNYGQYLPEALQSCLLQTCTDIEIIVVEGGSTDNTTRKTVEEMSAEAPDRVQFIFQTSRCLPGENRNTGIRHSRGRYICCLDADDVLLPPYIEVASFLAEAYGYDIVYPSVMDFGRNRSMWWVDEAEFPRILECNQISTTALFRKSLWAHVGGFIDGGMEDSFAPALRIPEDYELWVRCLGHGFRGKRIRELLMLHRTHDCNLTKDAPSATMPQLLAIYEANKELLQHDYILHPTPRVINPLVNLLRRAPCREHVPGFILAIKDNLTPQTQQLLTEVLTQLIEHGVDVSVVMSGNKREHVYEELQPMRAAIPRFYYLPLLFDFEEHCTLFLRYLCARLSHAVLWLSSRDWTSTWWTDLRQDDALSISAFEIVDEADHGSVTGHTHEAAVLLGASASIKSLTQLIFTALRPVEAAI